jgi:DNA-binding MarR family transcriptional regulator
VRSTPPATSSVPPLEAGAAVTRLATAVGERVLEARATSGLSAAQLQVLRLTEKSASVTDLALATHAPKTTVSSVVDQLEALELIERTVDPIDRRRQQVRSTKKGRDSLAAFDRQLAESVEVMLDALPRSSRARLVELLAHIPDATRPVPLA